MHGMENSMKSILCCFFLLFSMEYATVEEIFVRKQQHSLFSIRAYRQIFTKIAKMNMQGMFMGLILCYDRNIGYIYEK